jgi:hypothetical protein
MSEFPLDRVEARWLVSEILCYERSPREQAPELSAWLSEKLSRIKLGSERKQSQDI